MAIDADDDPLTYIWHFGDGHRAIGQSVNYTWLESGIYTVTLIVTASDGVSSAKSLEVKVVTPSKLPTVSINDVTVSEGNNGTTEVIFTVSLSEPSTRPVTVN
jgi:PKD repeat protein